MKKEDWQWICTAILIVGSIWAHNGWWLLVLLLIWYEK